jgi:hypothetical protein
MRKKNVNIPNGEFFMVLPEGASIEIILQTIYMLTTHKKVILPSHIPVITCMDYIISYLKLDKASRSSNDFFAPDLTEVLQLLFVTGEFQL